MAACVYIKDTKGAYIYINEGHYCADQPGDADSLDKSKWGKRDDELPWKSFAPPLMENDQEVIRSGKTMTFMESFDVTPGERITALSLKTPFRDQSGTIIGIIGVSIKIAPNEIG